MAAFQTNSNDNGLYSPAVFNFDHLEPHVQTHLKNVYGCLAMGMLSAAFGSYVHFLTNIGEWYFITTAASVVFIVWLAITQHTKENVSKRLGAFSAFTFLSGASLGPLIDLVVRIEPRVLSTALSSTAVIFIGLSMAALLSNDRKYLYTGGLLFSGMFLLMLVGFLNMFLGSKIVLNLYIVCSLALFAMFVLYDTQLVVEKRRQGEEDFIWHSVALFLDVLQIFKLILIILARKEYSRNRRHDD